MWPAPLRHVQGLFHDDIERGHEAEDDGKEVDGQPRDVRSGAVLPPCYNVSKHPQSRSGAECHEDREDRGRRCG